MSLDEYLQDVRSQRFSLRSLGVCLKRVASQLREDVLASPAAVRSIWLVALGFFAAAFLAAVSMSLTWDRSLAYAFFLRTAVWILPACTFVTLGVGLLRDPLGFRLSSINVPLTLTLLRVVLVPGIVLFLEERHFLVAFITYLVAALSDVVDGWYARRFGQITPLGRLLDPLVDILFNSAMLAGLAAAQLLAPWVFGVAVLRYGILLVGTVSLYVFVGPVRIQPTVFGRTTGVVMSSLVALLTLLWAVRGAWAESLTPLTEIALGVLLSATVIQVLALGWYNLRLMTGKTRVGQVVGDVRRRAS